MTEIPERCPSGWRFCPRCGSDDVGTWGHTPERTDADVQDIFGCENCGLEVIINPEGETPLMSTTPTPPAPTWDPDKTETIDGGVKVATSDGLVVIIRLGIHDGDPLISLEPQEGVALEGEEPGLYYVTTSTAA